MVPLPRVQRPRSSDGCEADSGRIFSAPRVRHGRITSLRRNGRKNLQLPHKFSCSVRMLGSLVLLALLDKQIEAKKGVLPGRPEVGRVFGINQQTSCVAVYQIAAQPPAPDTKQNTQPASCQHDEQGDKDAPPANQHLVAEHPPRLL